MSALDGGVGELKERAIHNQAPTANCQKTTHSKLHCRKILPPMKTLNPKPGTLNPKTLNPRRNLRGSLEKSNRVTQVRVENIKDPWPLVAFKGLGFRGLSQGSLGGQ